MQALSRVAVSSLICALAPLPALAQTSWETAVNNGNVAPGNDGTATFRSYNQPSTNDAGVMVFRARAAAESGGGVAVEGVYYLDAPGGGPLLKLFERGDAVPAPNNVLINGSPSSFNGFPSTPRIDPNSNVLAHRGQHEPVWTYLLADGSETRVGTAGIYAWVDGVPYVAASQLGAAVEPDQVTLTFPWFSVPATTSNTRFDQFPGSPAIDGNFIVWKGNYTDLADGLGRTGIFYRLIGPLLPDAATGVIASSNTRIPNQPDGGEIMFGSTAPPSVANGSVYFTGFDVELAPTLGGVYRSSIAFLPGLEVIAGVGEQVPGEPPGTLFYNFSEGLAVSSDGSKVAFWGSWGEDFFPVTLLCPEDGNPDLVAYCLSLYPDGLVENVRVNQGIFLYDDDTGLLTPIARTGLEGVENFVFWGFSGRVPGVGGDNLGELTAPQLDEEEDGEFARWRSSPFMALSHVPGALTAQVAFKAERSGQTGIYMRKGIAEQLPLVTAVEELTTPGQLLDPQAPVDSLVSSAGVERDGFRNGRLALTASMLWVNPEDPDESLSWGGIYVTDINKIFGDGFED
jgi:hypothetical protein